MCDQTGIRYFTLAVAACAVGTSILLLIRSEYTQVMAEIVLTFGSNLYGIIITRYCVLYVPPDLFGSLSGLIFTLLSFGMMIGYMLLTLIINSLNINNPLMTFQVQFFLLGLVAGVLALALADYWKQYPPPAMGESTVGIETSSNDLEMHSTTTMSNANSTSNESTELLQGRQSTETSTLTCFDYREYIAIRLILLLIVTLAVKTLLQSVSMDTPTNASAGAST